MALLCFVQWSYGITCWEVFSAGKTPYPGVNPMSLIRLLETGVRMEKPFNAACSDTMYAIAIIICECT